MLKKSYNPITAEMINKRCCSFELNFIFYYVAICTLVPQFIRVFNFMMNKKEKFVATDPQQVMAAVRKQINNQGNSELFTNANEVSQRVQQLRNNNNNRPPVNTVGGLVDIAVPSSELPIEGNPSLPTFMEQFQSGTPVNTNTHIYTGGENTIVSNERPQPRNSTLVEKFDNEALGSALVSTSTPNRKASSLQGMEMNPTA